MEGVIGYVTLFAGNFTPRNWGFCNGQTINIASNTALFSILGTTYGGNGTTTFALPDLKGRTVVGVGQGPGLSDYDLGQVGGSESVTLTVSQMPAHTHNLQYSSVLPAGLGATTEAASGSNTFATQAEGLAAYSSPANTALKPYSGIVTMQNSGIGFPISTMDPFLALNYVICMFGVFPSRN
jgi:microcystin-dependent protein